MNFKIGDKIEIISKKSWNGTKGIVEKLLSNSNNSGYLVQIRYGDQPDDWIIFDESCVKLVTGESEITTSSIFQLKSNATFKDAFTAYFEFKKPKYNPTGTQWKSEGKCPLYGELGRYHLSAGICSTHGEY